MLRASLGASQKFLGEVGNGRERAEYRTSLQLCACAGAEVRGEYVSQFLGRPAEIDDATLVAVLPSGRYLSKGATSTSEVRPSYWSFRFPIYPRRSGPAVFTPSLSGREASRFCYLNSLSPPWQPRVSASRSRRGESTSTPSSYTKTAPSCSKSRPSH
jgi:hypothetical protein